MQVGHGFVRGLILIYGTIRTVECDRKNSYRSLSSKRCFSQNQKIILNLWYLHVPWILGPRWEAVITRPDFKSDAIFGFLGPNYICDSKYLIFFCKISTRARYVDFEKRCFPEGF